MSFLRLVWLELGKMLRRGRTYIGPLAMAAIVLAMCVGLKYGEGADFVQRLVDQEGVDVFGSPFTALFITRAVLPITVFLFLPLFVSLVAGDQISGEAADGTLRTLLARPVRRLDVIGAKFLVSVVYTVGITASLGLIAFAAGWAFFGNGGLVSIYHGITYFDFAEGARRMLLSYSLGALYLLSVTAVAFLVSVFAGNSLAPVGITMAVLLFFGAMGDIPYFDRISPYLFTEYAHSFLGAFDVPLQTDKIVQAVGVISAYVVGCFVLAAVVFSRKDIVS